MRQHTAMLDIPSLCRAEGLNVVTLEGWDTAQDDYKWTNPLDDDDRGYGYPPSGLILHGTAGTQATPVVQDARGRWSVAGAWVGLADSQGHLHSTEQPNQPNTPTIVFCASGPARYSAGYGYSPVLTDFVFKDIRPPLDAHGSDGPDAANRYTFNVEAVHPNNGSAQHSGVTEHEIGLAVVMHRHFGWIERTFAHRSWTRRKPVDPWFTPGGLAGIQDAVIEILQSGGCPWNLCDRHYTPPTSLVLGNGKDEHQGQCNVPDSQHASVIWAFNNIYDAGNQHRYDYGASLSEGRNQVFEYRQR